MRPTQVKILFTIILVPLLTVTILRGYLQYLWATKNGRESSNSTSTTTFDLMKELGFYL